jgi:SET domain-containing protein
MSVKECVQCSAQTRNGKRCKNTTCIYSEFCRAHTIQLFDLVLKKSSIPNSGKGLFTAVAIPPKKRIAKYTGDIKTIEQYKANPSGYAVAIPRGRVIDARSTQSGIARYANDCRLANKRNGDCKGNNSKFSISTRAGVTSIFLVSTKRISAGEEIFVSYGGKSFWG